MATDVCRFRAHASTVRLRIAYCLDVGKVPYGNPARSADHATAGAGPSKTTKPSPAYPDIHPFSAIGRRAVSTTTRLRSWRASGVAVLAISTFMTNTF